VDALALKKKTFKHEIFSITHIELR